MEKIYQVSTNDKSIKNLNCSWLASCCSHTFHRFTKALRKTHIFKDDRLRYELATLCFSLLLNTTELKASMLIINKICYVFLSKSFSVVQREASDFLQDAIAERPTDIQQIKSIIRKNNFGIIDNKTDSAPTGDFDFDPRKTIKAQSVFGKKFQEEHARISNQLTKEIFTEKNPYYFPEYLNFLLEKFMPYICILASYAFQGLDFTHITNCTIEKY